MLTTAYLNKTENLAVLPTQLPERSNRDLTPEARLLQAVLLDAIQLVLRPDDGSRERSEARQWVFSNDPRPFGFVSACFVCGHDPEHLRERITAAPETRKRFHLKRGPVRNRGRLVQDAHTPT